MAVAVVLAAAAHRGAGSTVTTFLTEQEKNQIRARVSEAESSTAAEIVTVIAHKSDRYQFIPILWAALLSLCVPGVYYLLQELSFNNWFSEETVANDALRVYVIQVLVFLALCLLFQWQQLHMMLIPASVKKRRAHRQALVQFVEQRVHWTQQRVGILLFVSVAEHYVEIVADQGIADKVDNSRWQKIVDQFVTHVRRGEVATGFTQAIDECSQLVSTHFPVPTESVNRNELRDHLIELDNPDY